jgi:hypothetical protein
MSDSMCGVMTTASLAGSRLAPVSARLAAEL